jgi:hypothetical protein
MSGSQLCQERPAPLWVSCSRRFTRSRGGCAPGCHMQLTTLAYLGLLAGTVAQQPEPEPQPNEPTFGKHGGAQACTNPPCAAPLLGDIGRTTVGGTDARTGTTFLANENVYGPFENGFGSQQDNILAGLGCSPGSLGHVAGGIDTRTAEQMVARQCGIVLPRVEGNQYISLLDECGGHTRE